MGQVFHTATAQKGKETSKYFQLTRKHNSSIFSNNIFAKQTRNLFQKNF